MVTSQIKEITQGTLLSSMVNLNESRAFYLTNQRLRQLHW